MSKIAKTSFDYSVVDADTKGRLIYFAAEIRKVGQSHVESGLELGRLLAEAKEQIQGETFVQWVERECGFSKSSAYRYIAAWDSFGDFPNLGMIELSAVHLLTTNEDAKKKAMKLAAKGINVTHSVAKELVEEAKPKEEPPPFDVPDTDGQDEESVAVDADTDVSGEDDETDVAETEVAETAPEPPEEDGTEPETVPGDSYEPRELTPKEKAIATRALCKQLYGKLDRLLDDLHNLKPDLFRRDECRKLLRASEEHLW